MSSHDLEIERGRYDSKLKPPKERLCPYCRTLGFSLSEDEVHFFSVCPMYNKNRNRLFSFMEDLYPNVNTLTDKDKFVWHMSQENEETICKVANYIFTCFKMRKRFSKTIPLVQIA